ncbi:hypothetical protein ACHWQZ_G014471 [Mnemiopsis leidyi]
MDSKLTRWSSLAEFLQSEKLSEYIPTFSTLDLKAFSKLTFKDIESQVSPIYDRRRILDAVHFAKACLDADPDTDTDPLRKLTPTNATDIGDVMKTPTKSTFNNMTTSTPSKSYLSTGSLKSALRPTKSLSPPVKQRGNKPRKTLSSYEKSVGPFESEGSEGDTDPDTTDSEIDSLLDCALFSRPAAKSEPPDIFSITAPPGAEEEEGTNLLRLRRNLGSSDPSLSTADKKGENIELQSYHRSRSNRRATEYRLSSGEFSPCHSPCPSPRALSPNRPPALPSLVNFNSYYNSHRRWSVASSASDYYSGSPSSLSSASSQERLYVPGYRVSDEEVSHVQLQRQHSQDAAKNRPRPRARSLSPERQPEGNLANETSFNIFKERFPQAKEEMEKDLQNFLEVSRQRSEGIVKGEANANFIHHRVTELAKDILEHSKEERINDTYFEEVSTTLMRLISDSERTAANMLPGTNTGGLVTKEASELLKIISRSARLLECLTFSVGSFYSKIQEGTIDELLRSTASLPRYISSRLSTKFGVIDSEDPTSPSASQPSHTPHPSSSGTEDESLERSSQFKEEDFENRKLISNGAYGEVFLVKHVESKELFALKRIRKDRVIERNEVQRAFMERDILSFMQNPFVVSMLCSFQTKTHLCMVLEYVEGGDVGTLLKNMGALEIDLARMYHAETLLALEYIHSYGIVHRDLKPENLLITKEGHIKLTDFGLSKCGLMQMATRQFENSMAAFDDETCIGTPDYIAPEVFYSRQYGFSVDWWSMGIILYQFLVGCTPFSGETIEALVENINPRNIEWPEDEPVEEDARNLILGLLFMDPSQRLGAQGAQEVKRHPFYQTLHWDELIMHKAEFVPYLDSEEDTSYFDSREEMYDHSITEDCLPSVEDNSLHIKYFDSVNWSSADHFIALNSPRNRHLSHDSIDSITDNQPSISTDDGHSSNGEQQTSFQTSTPVKVKPVTPHPAPQDSPAQPTFDSSETSPDSSQEKPEDVEPDNKEPIKPVAPSPPQLPNKSPVKKLDLSSLHSKHLHVPELDDEFEGHKFGERTISLLKGPKEFGFTLNVIQVHTPLGNGESKVVLRHLVSNVVKHGPAAEAGLKKDDLINAVNNISTHLLTHQAVVDLIQNNEGQVQLTVQNIAHTTIKMRSSRSKGKKKKRQSSFFRKAVHARGYHDSLSMEKILHINRSRTREKQNSDSDKSGGEQETLMIHGHQVFSDPGSEAEHGVMKPGKTKNKFSRRRPSSNFVAPVSPLARTPSPTGHNCYFNAADPERKTPRSTAQKTLHITHPRTQSLSSVTKHACLPAERSHIPGNKLAPLHSENTLAVPRPPRQTSPGGQASNHPGGQASNHAPQTPESRGDDARNHHPSLSRDHQSRVPYHRPLRSTKSSFN